MGLCASSNTVSPETLQGNGQNTAARSSGPSSRAGVETRPPEAVERTQVQPVQMPSSSPDGSYSSALNGGSSPSNFPPSTPRKRSTVKHNKWKKGDLIGAGSYGRVFMGLDTETGALLAIKELVFSPDDAKEIQAMQLEIDLMKSLDHPNIVKYLGTDVGDNNLLYIFTEWVPGGSLQTLLKKFGRFEEPVTKKYTFQILQGLHFLHLNRVVHRDIKGANILIDDKGVVKLADFGASKQLSGTLATLQSDNMSLRGTPYFMAPEVIMQTGHGRKADIWSVGCTVLQMSTGYPPWKTMKFGSISALMYHVANSKDPPPMPDSVSQALRSFLVLCFQRDPQKRPGAEELMQHEFVVGVANDFAAMTVGSSNSINISRVIDSRSQRSTSASDDFNQNINSDDAIQFDDTAALGTGDVLGTLSLTSEGTSAPNSPDGKFEPAEPFDIGSFSMKGELPAKTPAPESTIQEYLSERSRETERLASGVRGEKPVNHVSSPPIGDPSANPFSRINSTHAEVDSENTIDGSQSNNPQENSLTVQDSNAVMQESYRLAEERPIVTDTALRNAELAREHEEKKRKMEEEKRRLWEEELAKEKEFQKTMRQSM